MARPSCLSFTPCACMRHAHAQRSRLICRTRSWLEGLCSRDKAPVDGQRRAYAWRASATLHVVISDLIRSKRAYFGTVLGTRLLSRSGVVHVDGPLSVRAALTEAEMSELVEQAGLSGAAVRSCWPMRQLVLWSRP